MLEAWPYILCMGYGRIMFQLCTKYVWVMIVLCINYVYVITIFELIDLGVSNTLQLLVLVYSLCTCYVIYFVNYVRIMNIHNELWIFIMHYGFP